MITYTFTVPGGQPEKKIEAMSLKKATKKFQGGDAEEVTIEYINLGQKEKEDCENTNSISILVSNIV